MSNTLLHTFQSALPDDPDATLIRPSNWNQEHRFSGGATGTLLVRQPSESDGAGWTSSTTIWDDALGRLSVDALRFRQPASVLGVNFVAPAAPTGEHTWTLPTTLGAAGSVLTNNGAGVLSWTLPGGSSILPVSSGGTGLSAGVSGGIPAFNSTSTMVSSGLLVANAPIIGGGAGGVPSSGTRSGNTTTFVTLAGTATSGTCVQWDASGNAASTGAPCGTSGGSGITSLNLALGSAQTFGNDTNVTIVTNTGTGVHQLGWTGTLSKARGGTGGAGGATDRVAFWTSTTLGNDTHFLWSPSLKRLSLGLANDPASPSKILTVVGKSIGGSDPAAQITGTFAGADPTVNFPVAATFIGDFPGGGAMPAGFGVSIELATHDNAGAGTFVTNAFITSSTLVVSPMSTNLVFGVMNAGIVARPFTLTGTLASFSQVPVVMAGGTSSAPGLTVSGQNNAAVAGTRLESVAGAVGTARTALALVRSVVGQMTDQTQLRQDFILRDDDAVDNTVARFMVTRQTLDAQASFEIHTAVSGSALSKRLEINGLGQFVFTPTPTVGTFGLAASGTRTTELRFFTNSNTNAVGLVAPATATGDHLWKLPQTFGNAGSIMTNDGSGQLSWQTFPTTLVLTDLQVGPTPAGTTSSGPLRVSVSNSDNVNPFQSVLAQMVNGSSAGISNILVANDKVAVAGQAWRGAGGTSPIYGGVFNVAYSSAGVANGVEIGVINSSGSVGGQGLWLNGNGTTNRDNAILIDAQTSAKWGAGIRFIEGNVGAGATGSILNYGIIFDKSQDLDFIVIRPRVGVGGNVAFRITDPAFTANTFAITNAGQLMMGGVVVPLAGAGSISTTGGITTSGNIGANQYFCNGVAGFTTVTKTLGSCTFTFTGGILTGATGGAFCG